MMLPTHDIVGRDRYPRSGWWLSLWSLSCSCLKPSTVMQKGTLSRKSDICDGLAAQTSGFPGAFPYTDTWNPQLILVHHRSAVSLSHLSEWSWVYESGIGILQLELLAEITGINCISWTCFLVGWITYRAFDGKNPWICWLVLPTVYIQFFLVACPPIPATNPYESGTFFPFFSWATHGYWSFTTCIAYPKLSAKNPWLPVKISLTPIHGNLKFYD